MKDHHIILVPYYGINYPTGGVERGSISNIDQHGLKMLYTKFGAFITI